MGNSGCCHLLTSQAAGLPLPGLSNVSLLWFVSLVDSNDSLYGGDSKFLAENNKLCETVMAQILEHLRALAKEEVSASAAPTPAARSGQGTFT